LPDAEAATEDAAVEEEPDEAQPVEQLVDSSSNASSSNADESDMSGGPPANGAVDVEAPATESFQRPVEELVAERAQEPLVEGPVAEEPLVEGPVAESVAEQAEEPSADSLAERVAEQANLAEEPSADSLAERVAEPVEEPIAEQAREPLAETAVDDTPAAIDTLTDLAVAAPEAFAEVETEDVVADRFADIPPQADQSDISGSSQAAGIAEPVTAEQVGEQAAGRAEPVTAEQVGEQTALPIEGESKIELSDVELRGAVEAILLIVDEPVTEIILAQVLDQPVDRIAGVLEACSREYAEMGRGFELRRIAGGWRLYTRAEYAAYVEKFVLDGQQVRLTQAALETLAVVAYKQPVTRSRISAIRGVNCDGVVRTLVARGLIEECGSEPESGAFLYRTTTLFLEKLGLDSVEELPPLAPFLPDDVDEIADAQR
jgi:segregation and condensation protein B